MQAELAHLASPHKDPHYCPSHMNSTKMTPQFLNEEKKRKDGGRVVQGSVFLGEVRREKSAGEGEGVFFSSSILCVHGVCCLIETCPASCLPLTYIPGTGGWHLATSVAQHAQFPCRSSPKECSGAQREKWTYRLVQRGDESLSPSEAEKSPFFVVFLLIIALCNIRKHTGTPKVLLKPASIFFFFL